jgi:hypothetical protein
MSDRDRLRMGVSKPQLRLLVRATREALAAGLLRASELDDAYAALELLDSKLPAAEDHHPVGAVTGRLLLREEILRVLAAGEDAGPSALTLCEVDDRLTDKPEGTSIRRVVEELAREKLIAIAAILALGCLGVAVAWLMRRMTSGSGRLCGDERREACRCRRCARLGHGGLRGDGDLGGYAGGDRAADRAGADLARLPGECEHGDGDDVEEIEFAQRGDRSLAPLSEREVVTDAERGRAEIVGEVGEELSRGDPHEFAGEGDHDHGVGAGVS